MKRRRDPLYSNPIAQAVVRSQVMNSLNRLKTDSELQAWNGIRVPELVSDACMLLFAVAWAHKTMGRPTDNPDVRIMRGMASALADMAHHPDQIETHRPAVQSGLAAIERVLAGLEPLALGVGMVECKNRIAGGCISANDIHELLWANQ